MIISEELPEKLSDCLELAMRDLELCELDPVYSINMSIWHNGLRQHTEFVDGRKCSICFAGAVMAQTLNTAEDLETTPALYGEYNCNRLLALDYLRNGEVCSALNRIAKGAKSLWSDVPNSLWSNMSVADYENDPKQFKLDMSKIVGLLKTEGL